MDNRLSLSPAELDAIRGLRAGTNTIPTDNPIWDGLIAVGLVEIHGHTGSQDGLRLTTLGRDYRTG